MRLRQLRMQDAGREDIDFQWGKESRDSDAKHDGTHFEGGTRNALNSWRDYIDNWMDYFRERAYWDYCKFGVKTVSPYFLCTCPHS